MGRSAPFVVTVPQEVVETPEEQARKIRQHLDAPTELMLQADLAADGGAGACVGVANLRSPGRIKLNHRVELGIAIDEDFRGLGAGRLLMAALLDWAAENPKVEKVTLGVVPENVRAVELYEQLGFSREGLQLREMRQLDGTYLDHLLMAIWVKPGAAPPGGATWTPTAPAFSAP